MGFNSDQKNWIHGSDPPIFGAIFMANQSTKKECLKRKLFGLPPPQINFVEKVKCGMVLFLFEFEERKLFGVFQAVSEGALNIVPNAYDGKFPAQIRVTQIWDCKPLHERDFHDAILDNYYTSNKFNFGLSKHQVLKLLYLFDSRKMRVEKLKSPLVREECLDRSALREKYIDRSASPDHYRTLSESRPNDRDRSRQATNNKQVNMNSYPVISTSNISSFSDKHTIETEGFMIGDIGLSSLGQLRNPQSSLYSKSSVAGLFPSSESELARFCLRVEKESSPPRKTLREINLDDTSIFGDFIPLEDESHFEPVSLLPSQSILSRYENRNPTNCDVYEDLPRSELPWTTLFSAKPANFGTRDLSTPYSPSKHPPYVPSCQYPAKSEVDRSPLLNFENAEHIGLQSDVVNERVSVFSRLKDCEKVSLQNEDNHVDTDWSVDELMDVLSRYQRQWVKVTEKSEHKAELREVDDSPSEGEDAEVQQHVEEILVNFKRRNRGRIQSERDGLWNTVPRKRRKLLRPTFVGEETW